MKRALLTSEAETSEDCVPDRSDSAHNSAGSVSPSVPVNGKSIKPPQPEEPPDKNVGRESNGAAGGAEGGPEGGPEEEEEEEKANVSYFSLVS